MLFACACSVLVWLLPWPQVAGGDGSTAQRNLDGGPTSPMCCGGVVCQEGGGHVSTGWAVPRFGLSERTGQHRYEVSGRSGEGRTPLQAGLVSPACKCM